MEELVKFIAISLVDYPEKVSITTIEKEKIIALKLKVSKEDMGKVIGKQGKTANALRTVVKSACISKNIRKKVVVDIIED